jgi:DNA-binding NtrC family response regulator
LCSPALAAEGSSAPTFSTASTSAAHFLRARGAARRFTPSALEALSRYSWPGNVREVENLVERLTVLKPAGDLDVGDLPPQVRARLSHR